PASGHSQKVSGFGPLASRRFLLLSLVVLVPSFLDLTLQAATVSWISNSGAWNEPANWSSGSLPAPDDDVVIDRPGDITVTFSSGSYSIRSLRSEESFVLS